MNRSNEIIVFVDNALKESNSIDTKDVMVSLEVSKEDILKALYSKKGYCITGALSNYGAISKSRN